MRFTQKSENGFVLEMIKKRDGDWNWTFCFFIAPHLEGKRSHQQQHAVALNVLQRGEESVIFSVIGVSNSSLTKQDKC